MSERAEIRAQLNAVIRTDADLVAFLIDYFPGVEPKLSDGMSRTQKVNLLIQTCDVEKIKMNLELYTNAKQKAGQGVPSTIIKPARASKSPKASSTRSKLALSKRLKLIDSRIDSLDDLDNIDALISGLDRNKMKSWMLVSLDALVKIFGEGHRVVVECEKLVGKSNYKALNEFRELLNVAREIIQNEIDILKPKRDKGDERHYF